MAITGITPGPRSTLSPADKCRDADGRPTPAGRPCSGAPIESVRMLLATGRSGGRAQIFLFGSACERRRTIEIAALFTIVDRSGKPFAPTIEGREFVGKRSRYSGSLRSKGVRPGCRLVDGPDREKCLSDRVYHWRAWKGEPIRAADVTWRRAHGLRLAIR